MRILLLGGGNMGTAIVVGALKSIADAQVTIVDPNPERVRELLGNETVEIHETLGVVRNQEFDFSVLAVKPQVFGTLKSEDLATVARGCVVSIMAGITLAQMVDKLGTSRVIRTMPNLPAVVGQAMTVGIAGQGASAADCKSVEALFAARDERLFG